MINEAVLQGEEVELVFLAMKQSYAIKVEDLFDLLEEAGPDLRGRVLTRDKGKYQILKTAGLTIDDSGTPVIKLSNLTYQWLKLPKDNPMLMLPSGDVALAVWTSESTIDLKSTVGKNIELTNEMNVGRVGQAYEMRSPYNPTVPEFTDADIERAASLSGRSVEEVTETWRETGNLASAPTEE